MSEASKLAPPRCAAQPRAASAARRKPRAWQRASGCAGVWFAAFGCAALGCGDGAVLTLGIGGPIPSFGDTGQRVRNINELGENEYGATLTEDLLEIFFVSDRGGGLGGSDIWYAVRRSRADPFDAPLLLREASSPLDDTSPAISADGLTLWVGSQRELGLGGMDVWRLTRSTRGADWRPIENVASLNSALDDLPRPFGQGGELMPISSTRAGGTYQTFFAHREPSEPDFTWIEPLDALWQPDASMEEACLTDDGLLLFFRRAPPGRVGDLYVAWRTSTLEPFRDPISLSSVNSPADDRDPFLSADGSRFFFSSNRRDEVYLDIYATSVELPRFE